MRKLATCDFCGRSERDLQRQTEGGSHEIEIDEDGLSTCGECKARLIGAPLGSTDEDEQDDRIRALIGKSAGAICRTMNLPYIPLYQSIIDAVSIIAYDEGRYMSA
jgi:hypothetical protein